MNTVAHHLFRAIHEGKWLSIEYKNKKEEVTRYWVGIKDICLEDASLSVTGLHLTKCTMEDFPGIYIDSILSSSVVEGSWYPVNEELVEDISCNPHKYRELFPHTVNLKVLNYLADCSRLDTTPYRSGYALVPGLDGQQIQSGVYPLSDIQYRELIRRFQHRQIAERDRKNRRTCRLCMNLLSIPASKGLYVLAYRKLNFDVVQKRLIADRNITICREFTLEGERLSIRRFFPEEYSFLLEEYEENQELIKDCITKYNPQIKGVDDRPYILTLGRDMMLDLNREYESIMSMYERDKATVPIKAFFGELTRRPARRKQYPLALLNRNINLDQLLAVHHGLKYPLSYIQGPPGTGKTTTILNTIISAFFNGKTVLFTSYNNHPIDSVFHRLCSIRYREHTIPLPVIRLGNAEKIEEALDYIRELYQRTEDIQVYTGTLQKNRDDKIERTKRLSALLKRYEEVLDLTERREAIERLLQGEQNLTFRAELQGRQLRQVEERLQAIGTIRDEDALSLIEDDEEDFKKYLYYTSADYIQRLKEPKNQELLDIVLMEGSGKTRVMEFSRYLSQDENMKKFLRIFPIVITTSISSYRLGEPKPYFDMVVMDEASQCNCAVSLVPIIRGENLMLVGDPQQLRPVIVLDPKNNHTLKRKYNISGEYDYVENSIYKTYLACDSVSDEILLSYHYRCHEKIIGFNNRKYYNNKLKVRSRVQEKEPLLYLDLEENTAAQKNTAPAEARRILEYIRENRHKKIGIITPFANQKEYINRLLYEQGIRDVSCGTVHAFQGDEKDVILFSLAVTDQTFKRTYDWLKNNKELINVATSRAKEKLVLVSSSRNLERLHAGEDSDDLYELVEYMKTNGSASVTPKAASTRALGIRPYSTETETAFLETLNHALGTILVSGKKYVIHREVDISRVLKVPPECEELFCTDRFDFIVYEKEGKNRELPVLAIELDRKEHLQDEIVRQRERQKKQLCRQQHFEVIRVENSYARRYNYMKEILIEYFKKL